MEQLCKIFQSEAIEAMTAWMETFSAVMQAAERRLMDGEPEKIPLSQHIEKLIDGGLMGNAHALDGYENGLWLIDICRKIDAGDTEEIEQEDGAAHDWIKFYRYAKEYIEEHGLNEYGAETRARVYSVALHETFMLHTAEGYCYQLWVIEAIKAHRERERRNAEAGKRFTAVAYVQMYLQGLTIWLIENMEYRDEETGDLISNILRAQSWGDGGTMGAPPPNPRSRD